MWTLIYIHELYLFLSKTKQYMYLGNFMTEAHNILTETFVGVFDRNAIVSVNIL